MNSDRFYKTINVLWTWVQNVLVAATKAYLNTTVGQGFLKKMIDFAVDKLFDEVVDPIMRVALVKIGYKYDVRNGQRLIEKLKQAEESGNAQDYDDTVDDILGGV